MTIESAPGEIWNYGDMNTVVESCQRNTCKRQDHHKSYDVLKMSLVVSATAG